MKILYLFPHPDDESFGPAGAINQQVRNGDEVFLVTFTKGGATKVRQQLGLSIEEMGAVRIKEMEAVKQSLKLSGMHILDYEDGALSAVNPLALEEEVKHWLETIKPQIVVTYPVHGGSGHHDHIALHAAVNRVFHKLKPTSTYLKRLAFFTMPESDKPLFMENATPRVRWTSPERIGAVIQLSESDIQAMKDALLCYDTYQEAIRTTKVVERIGDKVHFELAGEKVVHPLSSLSEGI